MTERDARLADFGSWHTSLNGQRIALYGSGAAAEDVACAYAGEIDLVCVVDDSRAGETAFGLEVTTLKEALTRGVETIVIATKAPNIEPIYQRICGMCQAAGIRLLDLYGNDLYTLHARLDSQDTSLEGLLEAVGRANVVCIDSMVLAGRFGSTLAEELEGGSRMARSCKAAIELATAQGKQLVIVCDGENTAKASAEVLCEWDMQAPVTYISSEDLGCHKENGLFRRVKEGFLGKRILHVGCDRVRDGIYALVFGLDAYLLSNAASEAVAFVPLPSPNSPEAPTSSVSLSFALGEAVFGYLAWLSARLGEGAFDGVLFPARDGDVLIRAYDILRSSHPELDLPPAFYPLLSRKAVAAAFLDRPEAQRWIAASSTAKTLSAMVGLDLEPADDTYESRLLCLCEARPKLEELATTTREGILGHLRSLGLREGSRYAFCEFVSAGTCQQLLERIVPFELHGFYFGTHGFGLESQSIECFFSSEHEAFMACHVESETLVSSVEPPLAGFLRDGTPRFDHDDRTPDELAEIGRTHAEILDLLRSLLGSSGHRLCAICPDVVNLAFAKAVGPRVAMTMTDSW